MDFGLDMWGRDSDEDAAKKKEAKEKREQRKQGEHSQ